MTSPESVMPIIRVPPAVLAKAVSDFIIGLGEGKSLLNSSCLPSGCCRVCSIVKFIGLRGVNDLTVQLGFSFWILSIIKNRMHHYFITFNGIEYGEGETSDNTSSILGVKISVHFGVFQY